MHISCEGDIIANVKLCLNQVKHLVRLDYNCGTVDTAGVAYPVLDLVFMDDTGSDTMLIFDTDMKSMMGADATPSMPAPYNHLMGYSVSVMADGSEIVQKEIAVQVNMLGTNVDTGSIGNMVPDWTTVPCAVSDPSQAHGPGNERLNGTWVRSVLYVGSAPEAPIGFYASTSKRGLLEQQGLPSIPYTAVKGPFFPRPHYAAVWTFDQTKNLWTVKSRKAGEGALPGEIKGDLKAKGDDKGEGDGEGDGEDEGDGEGEGEGDGLGID